MRANNQHTPAAMSDRSDAPRVAHVSALPSRSVRDAELMQQVSDARDGEAFEALTMHYGPRLKAWLMHRGETNATAEDIVQDVMVAVWQKSHLYNASKASFSTWIYRLTRNRWIDHKRKHGRLQPTAPEMMAVLADEPVQSAELDVEEMQVAEAVQTALATLPQAQKQMLFLSFFEGLSHSEIANRTGVPLGTVKSRIRAPLKQLRETLKAFDGYWK